MNEIFSFRKELNIKKIIVVISVLIVLILTYILIAHINTSQKKQQEIKNEQENPNSTFYSENHLVSVTLPKTYGLSQYAPRNNYLIELRSKKNLNIFISYENLLENRTLSEIASADIKSYIETFSNYSNLSEAKSFNVGEKQAYTYSFHYPDSKTKTTYYLQVIWLQTATGYFIFDIEFPLNDLNNYTSLIDQVLNSLTLY